MSIRRSNSFLERVNFIKPEDASDNTVTKNQNYVTKVLNNPKTPRE